MTAFTEKRAVMQAHGCRQRLAVKGVCVEKIHFTVKTHSCGSKSYSFGPFSGVILFVLLIHLYCWNVNEAVLSAVSGLD